MILKNLNLSNYKQYAALSLEFREGLIGIIGKNGAGKSTIFEAILYCLFGRDDSNKNLVRSSFADPKANVLLELEFGIGESQYRVRREFRGKALAAVAELYKNDLMVAKGVSAVNEELVSILHIEREAFTRSVFSGQKELSELSDTSGEARKRMVRKMLGLDTLDEVQSKVNGDIRDLNSRIAGQSQNLLGDDATRALHTDMEAQEKELTDKELELEKENTRLKAVEAMYNAEKRRFEEEEKRLGHFNALQRELAGLLERLSGLRAQREQLDQKKRDLEAQKQKLEAGRGEFQEYFAQKKTLERLEQERQRHVNREARLGKIAETTEQLQNARQRIAAWEEELKGKNAVETTLQTQQERVAALEQEIKAKIEAHHGIEQKIGGIQSGLRERSEKLDQLRALGRSGTCPTCLQPLLEGYERALGEIEQQINALQNEQLQALEQEKSAIVQAGSALRKQQESARSEVETALKELSRLNEIARQHQTEETLLRQLGSRLAADEAILREIGETHFDETGYNTLKIRLGEQEKRYLEFSKEDNYVARELPATRESLAATEKTIAEAETALATKNAGLAQLAFDENAYHQAKQALTGFADKLNVQSEAVRALEKSSLEIGAALRRNRERLEANERIQSQISDKIGEIELLRKLTEMLGLFKTEILEKISPGISREASDLFSRITKGKYESIRVDENFDFAIADGGVFYPIERFSGGEIDLANFCLRIAITKAIMDLSGAEQGFGFLAFDEIFGSQDEDRRLEMMLALNYLQEQFRQIYIVSHIESLKDYFPHILEVQGGEGGSAVVWR